MAEIPQIVLPHGGYRNLIVYRKSDIIYEGTVLFCHRFLPAYGDRTVDQMTQAARSCKQNIAEGSSASGTSKETEIKLTNVARATLDELLEDFLDYLKSHDMTEWSLADERKTNARIFARQNSDWENWKPYFLVATADVFCNYMIVEIQQTRYLLEKMIKRQEEDFKCHGGVRERMHATRSAVRGEEWEYGIFSRFSNAKSMVELQAIATELKTKIDQEYFAMLKRKGWA